jgi:tetratricopeptide (TPR) repeat protein
MPKSGTTSALRLFMLVGATQLVGSISSRAGLLEEARTALAKHDWAEAYSLADEVILASPDSADGFQIRGLTENRLNQYREALVDFATALKIRPNDAESFMGRGRTHRFLIQYDAAVADFTRAHEIAPQLARPLCERGALYILQDKLDASLADYFAAEKVDPNYRGLNSYFAEVYIYMRRPTDALASTKKGIKREPNSVINKINLGHSLLFLGRYEEAKAVYLQIKDIVEDGKDIPARAVIEHDFWEMKEAGLSIPDMDRIEKALGH